MTRGQSHNIIVTDSKTLSESINFNKRVSNIIYQESKKFITGNGNPRSRSF